MNTALCTIGFFLLLHGVYQMMKYLIVISEVKKEFFSDAIKSSPKQPHKISIFAPVLHEEKTIEKFLKDLSLQDYPKDFFKIYLITTQKEYLDGARPNTIDILDQMASEKTFPELQINRIHYHGTSGFKTHQLDFAFNQIRKNIGDEEISKSYFLFLDADSEADENMLARFNDAIEEGVEIYQQPLLWFKNIDALENPLMQSFGFMQSFFSVSYEIPMFTGRFFPWRLKYFVGHGLFAKGSFLLRMGGFPDIIEDVRLGRLSSFLNIKAKLVPGFGVVEVAKSFPTYIKQSSVWFFGCGLFLSDYAYAQTLKGGKRFSVRDAVLILYGFFKAFRWLNKGLLHLVGILLSIYYASTPLILLFLSSLLLNSTIPVLLVSKDFKMILQRKLGNRKRIMMTLRAAVFSPFLYMLNFPGLYYGLAKLFKFYLWGQITLPKTER